MFNLFYYSMKNIKLFSLLFVAAAMIFAGCTKETESVEPGGGEGEGTEEGLVYKEFTVGVSEAGGSKSRTELGPADEQGNRSVLWQKGDEIRVFADVDGANPDGYKFTVTGLSEDKKTATISGEVANATQYYGLYPYDAYSEEGGFKKENGSVYISANIPVTQTVPVGGGYDPKACISVANLGDGKSPSQFKLACGILGLRFKNGTNSQIKIKEFQVDFEDYSSIEGYMKLNLNGEAEDDPFDFEYKTFSIKPTGNGEIKEEVVYYVCLPPINVSQDIKIKYVNLDESSLIKTVSGTLARAESSVAPLLELTEKDYIKTIANADDFFKWYKGDINESPEVVISGTIDMSHKDPLNAKHFTGVLKGEPGTVIKGLTMYPSSEEGPSYNGLFASLDGATISNIELHDLKILNNDVNVAIEAGTICGRAKGESKIEGCKVICADVQGGVIGGIVGHIDGSNVDGIELTDITLSATGYCGGLVGYFQNSDIIASYITGKINSGAPTGGIVGHWDDSSAKLISCYSFMELNSGAKYIYGDKFSSSSVKMHTSWYVNNSLTGNGVMTVQGLKDIMGSDDIDETMNNYLKKAKSGYRYVVNPNYSVEDFSTPPLILEKAQ